MTALSCQAAFAMVGAGFEVGGQGDHQGLSRAHQDRSTTLPSITAIQPSAL